MSEVKVRQGENIDSAIKRFKRECEKEGLLQEIKLREYYKPPSVLRKEKNAEIKRRQKYKKRMDLFRAKRGKEWT